MSRFCILGRNGNGKGNCIIGFCIVVVVIFVVSFERIFVGGKESCFNYLIKDFRMIEKLYGKDFLLIFLYVYLFVIKF